MTTLRFLGLALLWCVFTHATTAADVAVGLVVAALLVVAGVVRRRRATSTRDAPRATPVLRRSWYALELAAFFLYELVVSNVRLAIVVLRPRLQIDPAILAVPIEVACEEELTVLSNLVTLTPGTLTLDVSDDQRTLFVHVLDARDPDAVRSAIQQGLARRVRRVFA